MLKRVFRKKYSIQPHTRQVDYRHQSPVVPIFFFLVLVWGSPAPSFGQAASDSLAPVQVAISAAVASEETPLNRRANYTIQLKWQGRLADIEFDPLEPPLLSNFKMVGSSSSNWVGLEDGRQTSVKTFAYSLQPEGLGMGYVEGMAVHYLDKATGEKHALYTDRLGIKVIEAVPEPNEAPLGLALTIGLLVCAGLVALVFHLEARANKKEAARLAAMAEKPLEQEFLDELKSAVDINTTDLKEAFVALSKLMRRYLHRRYGIPAQGISTPEVVTALRQANLAEDEAVQVEEVLQTCEVFKFSGEAGEPARLGRVYALTENFLQKNSTNIVAV